MNKPYNELSKEQKIDLLHKSIKAWKNKEQPYEYIKEKYEVAITALHEYYNDPPKFDFPIDPYNPPQEVIDFYKQGGFKTPPVEWEDEMIGLIILLEV